MSLAPNACSVSQSCLTLCDPVADCSPPGSSVHGILQARMLEWVSLSFCRGSSQPRDRTRVSCVGSGFFTPATPGKSPCSVWRVSFSLSITFEMGYYDPCSDEDMEVQAGVGACLGGRAGTGTPFIYTCWVHMHNGDLTQLGRTPPPRSLLPCPRVGGVPETPCCLSSRPLQSFPQHPAA